MRHIQKGGSPAVLSGTGAAFQAAMVEYATTGQSSSQAYAADLAKFAVIEAGAFGHYASGLFSKYSYYSDPTVKRLLIAVHGGKCAFCECFIMGADVGDVEHFRPKAEVTELDRDDLRSEVTVRDHPGYYWLAAEWSNLFLSCRQCNQAYKRNLFEVFPGTGRVVAGDVSGEIPTLLNPGLPDDRLRQLIRYDPSTAEALIDPGAVFPPLADENDLQFANATIKVVGLNRPRLVEARANHLVKLRALFVLVASNGAVLPARLPAQLTDARPLILDFLVEPGTASADALLALDRATASAAEFSALAIDALLVWSAALQFAAQPAHVSLQQENQVCVQMARLRLDEAIALAERVRANNAASSADESEPDTADLDELYNRCLRSYRKLVGEVAARAAELDQRRAAAQTSFAQHQQIRTDNGLAAFDEQLTLARAAASAGQTGAAEALAQLVAVAASPPYAQLIAEDDQRRAQIDALEEPLDDFSGQLVEMHGDLIDAKEGYRVRGAPQRTRGHRCDQLEAGIDAAWRWLTEGGAPAAPFDAHLQGRDFPPAIRR